MHRWKAKYIKEFAEYEIIFVSTDVKEVLAVQKVCCDISDGKVKGPEDVVTWESDEE